MAAKEFASRLIDDIVFLARIIYRTNNVSATQLILTHINEEEQFPRAGNGNVPERRLGKTFAERSQREGTEKGEGRGSGGGRPQLVPKKS